jgi:hypothetical protein
MVIEYGSEGNGGLESKSIREIIVKRPGSAWAHSSPRARMAWVAGAAISSTEDLAKNVCVVEQCWLPVLPLSGGFPPLWW